MDELMNVSARMGAAQGSRASNAMPELAGVDMRALEQQASTLWKFLDGLAESDPAEYARFIERQAAAASEETARSMAVPVRDTQPGLIVEVAVTTQCRKLEADSSAPSLIATAVAEQPSGVAVINLWAAKEGAGVPVPRTAQGPVHMHTTCWDEALVPLMELRSPSTLGVAQHYHAAVHATTVDLVASGQPLQMSALMAASACQWVESKYGVKCVGKPVLKVYGGLVHSSHQQEAGKEAVPVQGVHMPIASTMKCGNELSKPLIQDLSEPTPRPLATPHGLHPTLIGVSQAMHETGLTVVVEVHVPNVSSASDISLEFEGASQLCVSDCHGSLQVCLPNRVDADTCVAKYDACKNILKVIAHVAKENS